MHTPNLPPDALPPHQWNEGHWRDAFRVLLGVTIADADRVDDAIAGGWGLGRRRSKLLDRNLIIPVDVTHGLSIFCFVWLKPPVLPDNYEYLTQNRWRLFEDARNDPEPENRFEVVPDWLLRLDTHQLHAILQNIRVREIIKIPTYP